MHNLAMDPFKVAQISSTETAVTEMMKNRGMQSNLIKAYRLYQKMMVYPGIIPQMRAVFLSALEKKLDTSDQKIREEARNMLINSGSKDPNEEQIAELSDILIDFMTSATFSSERIENYINFARKRDQFSRLVHAINQEGTTYEEIKKELQRFCRIPEGEIYIPSCEAEGARVGLISHFVSDQLQYTGIAKHHITIRDIGEITDRMISIKRRPGKIGGKSAGMILANKILSPRMTQSDRDLDRYIRMPESWYISTGIFSDFIAKNNLYHFYTQKYKRIEDIEKEYEHISDLFERASFPDDVIEKFKLLLEKIGEHPILLRSSSLLEDNFDCAFSDKYDSVFLINQGSIETRLDKFIQGLKKVHMSTYSPVPIIYRKDHDLIDFNEKMSVLVQRVVGRKFGRYFFPLAAGVAFSYSAYANRPHQNRSDGIMRLVMGFGTRAVERVGDDYAKMVQLGDPGLEFQTPEGELLNGTQKNVDVLNFETGKMETVPVLDLVTQIAHPDAGQAICDHSPKQNGMNAGCKDAKPDAEGDPAVTFDTLLNQLKLRRLMKKMLKKLEKAYGCPVDVEFVWDNNLLYVVQCRPLSIPREEQVEWSDDLYRGLLFFKNSQVSVGGRIQDLEYLVYVDPEKYSQLPSSEEKFALSRVVSRINRKMGDKPYALFGPGRWGSRDINMGVRAGYSDFNNARVIGEIGHPRTGSMPDVSYGTHFFNDLVESGILHVAISPHQENSCFRDNMLQKSSNMLGSILPDDAKWEFAVSLIHIPSNHSGMRLHIIQDSSMQKGIGYFF